MLPDVLIIGAGLAGATAAVELTRAGHSIAVVEGRERVGGRGFSRNAAECGEMLDLGGSWITPWQTGIRRLAASHGITLRPRHPVTARRWFRDGGLYEDGPASPEDRGSHEAAIARMATDAAMLKLGRDADEKGRPLRGVSLAEYLDRLRAIASTRAVVGAWWAVSGNGDKARVPASEFLTSLNYGNGTPDGMCEVWAESLSGGVSTLVQRMLAGTAAPLDLGRRVPRISTRIEGLAVTFADGSERMAKTVLVATGLNPMRDIRFDPPLSAAKRKALSVGHLGRAMKVWAKVRGVPAGTLATGGLDGIEWMFAERATADGATMLVGFGVDAGESPIDGADAARKAVKRFFPNAQILAVDWHDWIKDPFSQGTWVASAVGAEDGFTAAIWRREGRIAFASRDIASSENGWFEAAVISGREAASELMKIVKT